MLVITRLIRRKEFRFPKFPSLPPLWLKKGEGRLVSHFLFIFLGGLTLFGFFFET
jgi:hypothetical protein